MVKAGMKPVDALVSTTSRAAELMGCKDMMGQIKPGFWADLILVDGNPLEDIKVLKDKTNIKLVIKAGKIEADRR